MEGVLECGWVDFCVFFAIRDRLRFLFLFCKRILVIPDTFQYLLFLLYTYLTLDFKLHQADHLLLSFSFYKVLL